MPLPLFRTAPLIVPVAPNLPRSPAAYSPQFQEQFSNALRLYFNQIDNFNQLFTTNTGGALLKFPNGSWYDTGASQTAAVIDTPYAVRFDHTTAEDAVSIDSSTHKKITTAVAGYYNFQFSLQLSKTTGSSAYIWIWPRVNGVDIADSNTKLAIQGTNAEVVAAWNFVLPMNAGDYFELMWATSDTHVVILRETANAFSPAIPSSILTATFVSALYT